MSDIEQFFSCSEGDESDFEFPPPPPPLAPELSLRKHGRSPWRPQSQRATRSPGSPRSKCAGRSRERRAAEVRPPYVSCGAATAATYDHPRPAAGPAQAPFHHPRPVAGQAQASHHPRYPCPVARQAQAPYYPRYSRPVASQAQAPLTPDPLLAQRGQPPTLNPRLKRRQQSRRSCSACGKTTRNFARSTNSSRRHTRTSRS